MPDKDHPQFVDCGQIIVNPDKVKYFYLTYSGEYHVVFDDGEDKFIGNTENTDKQFFYYLCNPSEIPWGK